MRVQSSLLLVLDHKELTGAHALFHILAHCTSSYEQSLKNKHLLHTLLSAPAVFSSFFKSSWNSVGPYPREISIMKHSYSEMNAANFVSDWRPEPPTPTRHALPRGCRKTRLQSRDMRGKWKEFMGVNRSERYVVRCFKTQQRLVITSAPSCVPSPDEAHARC